MKRFFYLGVLFLSTSVFAGTCKYVDSYGELQPKEPKTLYSCEVVSSYEPKVTFYFVVSDADLTILHTLQNGEIKSTSVSAKK